MRPRLLVAEPRDFSPRARAILDEVADVELRELPAGGIATALASYDAVWLRLGHRVDAAALQEARCRVLALPVTGLDHIDLAACAARGVKVVSLKGETEFLRDVRATAELTVLLTMALLRRLVPAAASVAHERWDRDSFRGRELYGKTAGIVGVGRLGTLVAGYFRAFGMRVLGHDRGAVPAAVAEACELPELLQRADVVSLHVGYDETTRHLIGRRELAAMRPDAILVNTSRGGVVDEAALLDALRARRLAGAALDVLDGEPDVASHPLVEYARAHENLLLTPHVGGNTVESFEKTEVFLAGRVVEALA